jgi:phage tail-like protein
MANSSYLEYLPPVLWVPEEDPPQTLGRHLRIYEKMLTGLSASGLAIRAFAPILNASADHMLLASGNDLSKFQVGDWITIQGTAERRQIDHFTGNTIFLDANLAAAYGPATVRVADLIPGQTTFRADSASRLEAGRQLQILQAGVKEDLWIAAVSGDFLNLAFGLVNTYSMDPTFVPVKLIDPIAVTLNGKTIPDFESRIDLLFTLFNPWRTRTDFLPYLASWVALDLQPEWNEYQKRKLIAEMAGIYQLRGLKQGIYTQLDIYAVSAARPRIVVDDNEAVFHAVFSEDGKAALRAVAHSNTVSPPSVPAQTVTVLLHPTGIAVDSQNFYFVSDPGSFGYSISLAVPRAAALWRMTANGDINYGPAVGPLVAPMPKPIFTGAPLEQPMAVVVDGADRVSVVDTGNYMFAVQKLSGIYRFAPPTYAITTVINQTTAPVLPAVHPVDMILDGGGNFVILDRGFHPFGNPPAGASAPQIVVVSEGPLAAATHTLGTVSEPTAIIMDASGRFIVADAQLQGSAAAADLVRVDPAGGWTATSLLGAVANNPLIFPTGMVWETDSVLLVSDTGVRWGFVGDSSNRVMAEEPHLYRVDLSQAPPVISQVTNQRQLVRPTRMGRDRNGRILVVDAGEFPSDIGSRSWRAGANEFGVAVLFSNQRPTSFDDRNLFRRGVVSVVDSQMPAHTSWWMDF